MTISLSTLCWDREVTTKRYSRSIEPMAIPLQPYIALRDLIDWMGCHVIEIPEDMAQRVEAYSTNWESTLTPWAKKKSLLFPPEPQLALTYRRWKAAAHLYENLVVIEDHQVLWRNWSVTGEPRCLRTDERLWAISVLESIARAAERHLWATLNGEREFNPAADINFPIDLDEKQRDWLDSLGFEKKEIFVMLSPEFIVKNVSGQKHSLTLDATVPTQTDQSTPTSHVIEPKVPPVGIDRFPASGEIIDAFAGVLNKNKDQWRNLLKDPPSWLKPARIKEGERGSQGATWDPLEIARTLFNGVRIEIPKNQRVKNRYETVKTSPARLDGIFRTKLPAWDLAWQSVRDTLEGDDG